MNRRSLMVGAGMLVTAMGALLSLTATQASEQLVRFQRSPAAMKEQLAGSWRLVSIYQENDGGEDVDQFGGVPEGLFMADREGNFSFQIMSNHGRHLFANSPPAVVMARYDGLLEAMTYFGAYAVDEEKRELTLLVAHCQFRGCDRADRKAELSIKGDTLTMTSAVEPSPTGAFYSYTVWKRECCR